jgi:general secretion pathway protein G
MRPRIRKGFTLVEVLVVIAVIGMLATVAVVATAPALKKGRDAKRKASLSQLGRLFTASRCYLPDGGAGDYDLGDLFAEVKAKYPQYAQFLTSPPKDPRGGTDAVTKYRYVVADGAAKCALYANLEHGGEPVTLEHLDGPTAGGGTGVVEAAADGPNGTPLYFQVSN